MTRGGLDMAATSWRHAAQHAGPPGHQDLLFEATLNFLGRRGRGGGWRWGRRGSDCLGESRQGYQMCWSHPTNKISGLTLALEVCHSSQSVAFNSLTGIAPEFKCRMAADGVE